MLIPKEAYAELLTSNRLGMDEVIARTWRRVDKKVARCRRER